MDRVVHRRVARGMRRLIHSLESIPDRGTTLDHRAETHLAGVATAVDAGVAAAWTTGAEAEADAVVIPADAASTIARSTDARSRRAGGSASWSVQRHGSRS